MKDVIARSKPLCSGEIQALVESYKIDRSPSTQHKIIDGCIKIIVSVAYKFDKSSLVDIVSGQLAVFDALETYTLPPKAAFTTYVYPCIRRRINRERCLGEYRTGSSENSIFIHTLSLEHKPGGEDKGTLLDTLRDDRIKPFDYNIKNLFTDINEYVKCSYIGRDRDIYLSYLNGYTQKELSETYGMTKQGMNLKIHAFNKDMRREFSEDFNLVLTQIG